MKFNPKARLDRGQARKRSAGGGGGSGRSFPMPGRGGGGSGMPGGLPTGGGVVGLVLIVILFLVVTKCGGGLSGDDGAQESSDPAGNGAQQDPGAGDLPECQTGADTDKQECRILAVVNSVQSFWSAQLPDQAEAQYEESQWQDFRGSTQSACGQASAATGPFYCPVDKEVYLDTTFFDDMLEGQLGAGGGDFAEAYVVAHEYGHHVQDLLGTLSKHQSRETGPTSPSVRIELQADCYAGVWANGATTATDADGEPFILEITDSDISEAIDAATAVGDDRIQKQTQGRVNEEEWTHGSAAERVRWFTTGFESGSLDSCDTFSTDNL